MATPENVGTRMNEQMTAAVHKLNDYIVRTHWNSDHLVGPDPVGKVQWRITRFVRSYVPQLPNDDRYVYLQGMAYWIKANLRLWELTGEEGYLEKARRSADYMVAQQSADGIWLHPPIPGRRGFVSTVEGVWASLGLLAMYRADPQPAYLEAAKQWYAVQTEQIGFQPAPTGISANYYAHSTILVPNVTTMLIWLCAELVDLTGDAHFGTYIDPMLEFIEFSQLASGELPYEVDHRPHFMCYQYNSFEFMDLANYYALTQNSAVLPVLGKLAGFLETGVTSVGSCRYNCDKQFPEVNYWTAALATALAKAQSLGLGDYAAASRHALRHLLARQRPDGGFDFSYKNYRMLRDARSYPRYLSMILYLLLVHVDQKPALQGAGSAVDSPKILVGSRV